MTRNLLSFVYLAFAIAGAVFPTLSNFHFAQEYGPGFDFIRFIQLANANFAAESLSRDLLIGSGAVILWIITEAKRLKIRNLWIVFLGTFLVAFAFAAPLFLFLRERRIIELQNEGHLKFEYF